MNSKRLSILAALGLLVASCGGTDAESARTKNAVVIGEGAIGEVPASTTTTVANGELTTTTVASTTTALVSPTTSPVITSTTAAGPVSESFAVTPTTVAVVSSSCGVFRNTIRIGVTGPRDAPVENSYVYLRTTPGCPRAITSVTSWHEGPSGRIDEVKAILKSKLTRERAAANPAAKIAEINANQASYAVTSGVFDTASPYGGFVNFLTDSRYLGDRLRDSCAKGSRDLENYRLRFARIMPGSPSCGFDERSVFLTERVEPELRYLSEVTLLSCRNWYLQIPEDREKCRTATLVVRIVFSDGSTLGNIRVPLQ